MATTERATGRGPRTPSAVRAEPSVRLERVSKRYGDVTAVRELTLEVERGEFFTLLGPSGCGKTTTLRMVAGFEECSTGRILLDGVDVAGRPAFRRPTNTVFQAYALFPHLSVEDNVAFGLRRKRVPKDEVRRRVGEELERVGLAAEARRKPRQLSGGQQQRVALARALVNLPTVLLLDEPLGALDLKLRKGLQLELKRIQREVGITFVYVTHDQEEALTMSDRIAVMNRGEVEQLDGPEAVYERPSTAFVASFIGVSNLMPAEVVGSAGDAAELRLDCGPSMPLTAPAARGRCHAVVRPEKLSLAVAATPAPDSGASVEGTLESSSYLGTATQAIVRLDDGVAITALVPSSGASHDPAPRPGERVRLSWATEHTHVIPDGARSQDPEGVEAAPDLEPGREVSQ